MGEDNISQKYLHKIRRAIVDNGQINIQLLAAKFNILPGNTYFRNFIKGESDAKLGKTGLQKIIDVCGYEVKTIIVKKNDIKTNTVLDGIMDESFTHVTNIVSQLSFESKKKEVIKRKKREPIKNKDIIGNALFNFDNIDDDEDDDELLIG